MRSEMDGEVPLADGVSIQRRGRWLEVELGRVHRMLGWTIVGGGYTEATRVGWLAVRDAELGRGVDPVAHVRAAMEADGLGGRDAPDWPVFVTSSSLDGFVERVAAIDGVRARCVATVGLGNAVRLGRTGRLETPVLDGRDGASFGTINVLGVVSCPISDLALLEALSVLGAARTAAVLPASSQLAAPGEGDVVGTGTDCIVVAAPLPQGGEARASYAGLHTAIGRALGAAAFDAVRSGVESWLAAHARRSGDGA